LGHRVPGGYKYGDLALQVGGVSNLPGAAAIAHDRTVPSSERAPPLSDTQLSGRNKNLLLDPRWGFTPRETGRLNVGHNITLTFECELVAAGSRRLVAVGRSRPAGV
jgi:hypothetical protein